MFEILLGGLSTTSFSSQGPRVLFFINCGGLTHEFDELEFCEGGVTIIMDHRRPMANNTGLIGADVRWMTLTGLNDYEINTVMMEGHFQSPILAHPVLNNRM